MTHHREDEGWWSRNKGWALPTCGCGGCLGVILLFVLLFLGVFGTIFGSLRSSEPVKEAISRAEVHPVVVEHLGTPIEAGWFMNGSISLAGDSGYADIAVPLSGPGGSAQIHVVAKKEAGRWQYQRMECEILGVEERIDLLALPEELPPEELPASSGALEGD